MPGEINFFDGSLIAGWAAHPVYDGYAMMVHALVQGQVSATVLAHRLGVPRGLGFAIELPKAVEASYVQVMLGETDEYLELPASASTSRRRTLTIEDLIGTRTTRKWVTGECHVDAQRSGWPQEAIIEMLTRDILGRDLDNELIGVVSDLLSRGGQLDDVRKLLINSEEYRSRRIYADRAPGAIFSLKIVKAVSPAVLRSFPSRMTVFNFPAAFLLEPDDETFVLNIWKRLHGSEPDPSFMKSSLEKLKLGTPRTEVVKSIAALKKA